MADATITIPTFGNGTAMLATDLTDGVHTLKATTDPADSAIAIYGFGNVKVLIATVVADGVHTLAISEAT